MAPKPRPIRKKSAHLAVQNPASDAQAPSPLTANSAISSTRKTRASTAADATKNEPHSTSKDTVKTNAPLKTAALNPRKRAGSTALQPMGVSSKKTKEVPGSTGASGDTNEKAEEPRKKYQIRNPPAPPVEFGGSVSSDEDVALAVAVTRGGSKKRTSHAVKSHAAKAPTSSEDEAAVSADEDHNPDQQGSEAGDASDDADDGGEAEVQSDSSDGLESDDQALAAQLAAERPVWTKRGAGTSGKRPVRYADIGAPRSEQAQRFRDMVIEESSPSSDDDYDPQTDGTEEDEDDDAEDKYYDDGGDDEEQEWLNTIKKRARSEKVSKEILPLLPPTTTSEQPVWKRNQQDGAAADSSTMVLSSHLARAAGNDAISVSDSDAESDSAHPSTQQPNPAFANGPDVQPIANYAIVMPNGPGVVNLTAQHPHIRNTVRVVVPQLEARLALEDAFPDAISLAHNVHDAMITAANELGYTGLAEAFRATAQISGPVAAIVKQRMSTFRGVVKKLADTHAVAFYQLKKGCGPLVNALFDHLSYNYPYTWDPENARLQVQWHKPYGHEVYAAILHAAYFNGSNSMAAKHAGQFSSTLESRPDEKEIPVPMLAFVGTAIHAALTEWRTGTQTHVAFSADAYLDIYNEHKLLLAGIKAKNARGFHTMMHRLYRDASGATPVETVAATTAANAALGYVDFDGMEVD